jgi:metal-responsive CopG/Arc/MetJ family transcriptional regulator
LNTTHIDITLDDNLLKQLDRLVAERQYPSRAWAIEEAIQERLHQVDHDRLARECAKLDPIFEQQMADEGMSGDLAEWPEY